MDYILSQRRSAGAANIWLALGITALLVLALGLVACRGVDWFLLKRSLRSKFGDEHWITTQQLADWLADKKRPAPVLLDVRTPAEWKVSHLPGARRVDPQADAQTAAGKIAKRCADRDLLRGRLSLGRNGAAAAGRGLHAGAESRRFNFPMGE